MNQHPSFDDIDFDDIEEFSSLGPGAAEILARCEADLELSGLESITPGDVYALNRKSWTGDESWWQSFNLNLGGLRSLSPDVADALASRFDDAPGFVRPADLVLDGLESLSLDAATPIARFPGDLNLSGLTSIEVVVAKVLATHNATLHLDGLELLPADVAEALAGHPGDLTFDGVLELSAAAAAAVLAVPRSHREDDDGDYSYPCRSFAGLEQISPGVACWFWERFRGDTIALSNLRTIDAISAAELGRHDNDLLLDGLTGLDAQAAAGLARCAGYLGLDRLSTLSPDVAEALATHAGGLVLSNITSLDEATANALAAHQGLLDLSGLRYLCEAGARLLASHDGELMITLSALSERVQEVLREHPSLFTAEPGVPTRIPATVQTALEAAGIATVHVCYDGFDDAGGFEAFTVGLADGQLVDGFSDAEELAAAVTEVVSGKANSGDQVRSAAELLYQLIWAALPNGWEVSLGSCGEVSIDVKTGMFALAHMWKQEFQDAGEVEGVEDEVPVAEDDMFVQPVPDESSAEEAAIVGGKNEEELQSNCQSVAGFESDEPPSFEEAWGDIANQDRLIADDVAALADLLRQGASRKPWLDANVDRLPLWEHAANRGTAQGLMITGLCHWFGSGRNLDEDKAFPFFLRAAELGESQAQFSLGQYIQVRVNKGIGLETAADAYRWLLASAESGLAQAQYSVAAALWDGNGIEEDEKGAVCWLKSAADQGNGQAAFRLAKLLLTNRPRAGVKRDLSQAKEWAKRAVTAGNENATVWLCWQQQRSLLTADIAQQIFEQLQHSRDSLGSDE